MADRTWKRRLALVLLLLGTLSGGVLAPSGPAQAFAPQVPRLPTPWSSQVSTTNPLPEYPRPQLVRPEWESLNGVWQFAAASNLTSPPVGQNLAERVLVPYPVESALSGIERHEKYMYYRRTFTVPAAWSGRRTQLNFGAVNWESRVWVNGRAIGTHQGGYDPFSYDISPTLQAGANEIIVGVYAPVTDDDVPIGKQRLNPSGIWYTPASGIWQTVWIEPVRPARVTRLDTTPNVAASALDLVVQGTVGQAVTAQVLSGGQVVGQASGAVGANIRIPVPNPRLWSPDDPFLYDLKVSLTGTGGGDAVTGYFGMRSLGKAMLGGVLRPTLNGKFVFQLGTLDQGYWPDGIYTAPTDEALRFDLEQQKALGFNMVRKHIKVESARWFYHADRLGLLVWQDMPAMANGRGDPTPIGRQRFETELKRMVDNLKGITSIVQWVPFNEGWGEYDAGRIADLVRSWDPTRLVNHNSGSNCCESDPDPGNGDVIDDHMYVGPGMTRRPSSTRIAVLGEYGGLGMHVPGHEWNSGASFAYEMHPNSESLTSRYVQITGQLAELMQTHGVSGSVYTEPTDVENEINGFYTYDRVVKKMDFAKIRAVNLAVLGAAKGTALPLNKLISLQTTTTGMGARYVRHQESLARTDAITAASSATDKQDATFWVRPGLSDSSCYSLESRNFPGRYLRHQASRVRTDPNDGSGLFAGDATFCTREGLAGGGTSLEAANQPGRFLRHRDTEVWIDSDTGGRFREDATWAAVGPWWRSGADVTAGVRSFRVTTSGFDNRYLRHRDRAVRTDVISASSPLADRQDGSFVVRPGLGDPSCYSLESRKFPGRFLRHRDYRVYSEPTDDSAIFAQDATFCAQPPRTGGAGNVSLQSLNYPGHHLRHYADNVYISANGGGNAWDTASSYDVDVTWASSPPLAP